MKLKNEIIEDLSFDDYKAIPAMNWSLLKYMLDTPGAFLHARENPKDPTPAMVRGGGIDPLVLEPHLFWDEHVTPPKNHADLPPHFVDGGVGYTGKTKVDKEFRADVEEDGGVVHKPDDWTDQGLKLGSGAGQAWKKWATKMGLRVISFDVLEGMEIAAAAVLEDELAAAVIEASLKQVTFVWYDKERKVWCKGRPDMYIESMPKALVTLMRAKAADNAAIPPVGEPWIPDLKSTGVSARPVPFARQVYNQGWHRSQGHYCMGAEVITGRPHDFAGIVAVEQTPPCRTEVFTLPLSVLDQGKTAVTTALIRYAYWSDRDEWPKSSGQVNTVNFEKWMND